MIIHFNLSYAKKELYDIGAMQCNTTNIEKVVDHPFAEYMLYIIIFMIYINDKYLLKYLLM